MVGKSPHSNSYSHLPSAAAAASSSSSSPRFRDKSTCYSTVTEFACSACLLFVCCPISMVWCCVRTPCKIAWRLVQKAKCGGAASCCGCQRMVSSAAYSSFSDLDSDDQTSIAHSSCKSLNSSKNRI